MSLAALDVPDARVALARVARWVRRACAPLTRTRAKDRRTGALAVLSGTEKALLRRFLDAGTRTIHVSSPAIAFGLELAEILSIHRDPARAATDAPFGLVVQAWAWDELTRRPELVGGDGPGDGR